MTTWYSYCCCPCFGGHAEDGEGGGLNQRLLATTGSSTSEPLRPSSCVGHPGDDSSPVCTHTFNDVFILQDQIGKGSTATVYKCTHRKSGAQLAVKVIDKRRVTLNYTSALLDQFRMEVKILRALSHPNILKLFECFETELFIHVVTEYIAEGELFDYLVERPDRLLSEAEASGIVRQIAHALAYLHRQRVMHRDVKLENILVSRRPVEEEGEVFPQVKLIDFGLAKYFDTQDEFNAGPYTAQTFFGTMGYLAPEMTLSARGYNHAVDVWALGVLTYVLLCGVFPFEQDARNFTTIKYPPWATAISASAKDLMGKLLCADPARRLTASKACVHEWVAGSTASRLAVLGTPKLLEEYRLKNLGAQGMQWHNAVARTSSAAASASAAQGRMDVGVSPLSLDVNQNLSWVSSAATTSNNNTTVLVSLDEGEEEEAG